MTTPFVIVAARVAGGYRRYGSFAATPLVLPVTNTDGSWQ